MLTEVLADSEAGSSSNAGLIRGRIERDTDSASGIEIKPIVLPA
jgi:hypothetical protein